MIKIIESPREAMQGFSRIIPLEEKVRYINELLRVGFDTVEVGSIVSLEIIPQMAGSMDVIERLDLREVTSNLMYLVVNIRGAKQLAGMKPITHISYPFSFSSVFNRLNVNSTVEKSLETAKQVVSLCEEAGKHAVIYISMAFGNPYGDPWSIDLLVEWVGKLYQAGARTIPLSNVSIDIGETLISEVFSTLIPAFPDIEFGLHLHTSNNGWFEKIEAAWSAGCRRFDGVINGLGGCPRTGMELIGNLKTENLLGFAEEKKLTLNIDQERVREAIKLAKGIFGE
ncbi:MAG: hypothetical protein M0Q38_17365 [Bacteroidales bacterium]|jgi:hydroxymethylglutaryl-CoA lyase|nr:hypothetical protein [Bacteroidales bacterium]